MISYKSCGASNKYIHLIFLIIKSLKLKYKIKKIKNAIREIKALKKFKIVKPISPNIKADDTIIIEILFCFEIFISFSNVGDLFFYNIFFTFNLNFFLSFH